jgi:plastocyanin
MIRRSCAAAAILSALALVWATTTTAADSTISGTVKVTGQPSNADVVVYIQQAAATPAAKPLTMDQKQMQFLPRVLPVVAGTTVKFLNSDPTPDNVFSPDNEKYNLGTWPTGQTKGYTFSKCTKFPCVYTQLCKVHPEMMGFVVVLQNAFFGVSNKDGAYKIENVPPGSYTLGVWHMRAKAAPQSVTVEAGKPLTVDFSLAR